MHPIFTLHTPPANGQPKNLFCTLVSTKLHPSYHLNPSQPDYAMWQFPPFKSSQPYADTCHYPCKHICTNHTLPHHHLPPSHTWNPNLHFHTTTSTTAVHRGQPQRHRATISATMSNTTIATTLWFWQIPSSTTYLFLPFLSFSFLHHIIMYFIQAMEG